MSNSLDTLSTLLESKLQARLASAKPTMEHMITRITKAAQLAGETYDVGSFFPPAIDAQASLAEVKEGQKPVQAVTVYMSHASKVVSSLTDGAFRRLQRKNTTNGTSYLALYVVEDLLRSAVRAQAAIARMEAAANTGPFASGTPDFDHFDRLSEKATSALVKLYEQLEGATTGEDVVKAMAPFIQQRITGNIQRVYTSMSKAKAKAPPKTDHAVRVEQSSKATTEGLRVIVGTVKAADSTDTEAIGTALKDLYVLRVKFPFYFGITTRGNRGGKNVRKGKPAQKPVEVPKVAPGSRGAREFVVPETSDNNDS